MDIRIENLIDNLDFSVIILWAHTYDIPCHTEAWGDDEWPDKEDALRVAIKDCMQKAMDDYKAKKK